ATADMVIVMAVMAVEIADAENTNFKLVIKTKNHS
ncbi:MAG: hypothetical protein UR88_C0014G0001, partial [Candidatus Nomurabacteria bacterium GW2011_GWA1_35_8]